MATRKPKPRKKSGKWVFVPDEPLTPEQQRKADEDTVWNMIGVSVYLQPDMRARFAALGQFYDYFPDANEVPDGGAWILVKKPPLSTEYTVPPFSLWFAEPWPMESSSGQPVPKRVKILTPRGDLGLFPREYALAREPGKYYEFIGNGMSIHFFSGNVLGGVPEMPLFYLRSRGVSKADAIALLIGTIKSPGVCWMETDREVAATYVRDDEWPSDDRLATRARKPEVATNEQA
jgi:hypothetical protein